MSDFFGALQLELHAAGQRSPRRRTRVGDVAGGVAAAALVGAAVVVALVVMGGGEESPTVPPATVRLDPVGTVIPKGGGNPPRRLRSVVVATGATSAAGPWQLEFSRSTVQRDPETGVVYEPARLPCLTLVMVDPPNGHPGGSGQCGYFPRTPGFSRIDIPVSGAPSPSGVARTKELIVYGQVPERAAAVVVTAAGGTRIEATRYPGPARLRGDFYFVAVKPRLLLRARINWLTKDGSWGSRGIRLLPASAYVAGSKPPG